MSGGAVWDGMSHNIYQHLRVAVVIPLFSLSVASCGLSDNFPDDHWWTTDGQTQPDNIGKNGVTWVARPDGPSHWRYFPQQVSILIDRISPDQCGPIDSVAMTVAGKTWTLKFTGDNSWTICPPWASAAPPENAGQSGDATANSVDSDEIDNSKSGAGIVTAIFIGAFAVLITIPISHRMGYREGEEETRRMARSEALQMMNAKEEELDQRERQSARP